jgi:integrase
MIKELLERKGVKIMDDVIKKVKIKNVHYVKFLKEGIIDVLNEDAIKLVLAGLKHRFLKEARCLIISLYYTGARPNEILRLKAGDIQREGRYLILKVPSSKRGLPRSIYLPIQKPMVQELYQFVLVNHPEVFLFWHFRNNYNGVYKNKKGISKARHSISDRLRYYFRKWFSVVMQDGIPPYYLRHNRFSKLSEKGASMEQLRQIKGSRTLDSITPYLHMSTKSAQETSKKMD